MHIVFLTNEFPYEGLAHGGIGTFVEYLSEKLIEQNFQVSVVGISNKKSFNVRTKKGVYLYGIQQSRAKIGKFIFNSYRIRKTLNDIYADNPIDIVEGSELSFAFLSKHTPYKKVIRMHGGHHFFAITLNKKISFWRSRQEKRSFKKADALIAVSDFVGFNTSKYLKLKMPFTTIYNFIDLELFQPIESLDIIQNSIFFVGTICKKKGIKELIEAFVILKDKYKDASLHLIGRDWIDEEVGSFKDFVKTLIPYEILSSIMFYGVVKYNELPILLSRAHVCAYPSHMESFGLTLIEAMALEKPIIASDIDPFREIMENEVSGLLCNPFMPNEIAMKILELFENPQKAKFLAKNARSNVLGKFNVNSVLKENIQFYNSIL